MHAIYKPLQNSPVNQFLNESIYPSEVYKKDKNFGAKGREDQPKQAKRNNPCFQTYPLPCSQQGYFSLPQNPLVPKFHVSLWGNKICWAKSLDRHRNTRYLDVAEGQKRTEKFMLCKDSGESATHETIQTSRQGSNTESRQGFHMCQCFHPAVP